SKFCIDCGKPVVAGGARVIDVAAIRASATGRPSASPPPAGFEMPSTRVSAAASTGSTGAKSVLVACPHCSAMIEPGQPFCPRCGQRLGAAPTPRAVCGSCSAPIKLGIDFFCGRCGARTGSEAPQLPMSGTAVFSAKAMQTGGKLALLDDDGSTTQSFTLEAETTVGRQEGQIVFADDVYLSPVHAQFSAREGQLFVRDLGSRNGTWVFLDAPYRLQDGDTILVGAQLIRFRRLGYPGPHPPEADQTRRLGSNTPPADIAVLSQLRADGSARDNFHLSPGRSVFLGREQGDWIFGYDQTMSGKHAEIRSEDLEFIVLDAGSRNGIAVSVRGERAVKPGTKIMLGDQVMRVEAL
ncbi:MAG: FHA domain-containing protein, partial [Gemmatimonadaceae bacterium]|nr:FHA domain-containing protein [Gemmatimonadaceae bacterium]